MEGATMVSEAKKKSQARWEKEHCVRVTMKFNKNTDKEVIEFLQSVPSMQGVIREALKNEIARRKENKEG